MDPQVAKFKKFVQRELQTQSAPDLERAITDAAEDLEDLFDVSEELKHAVRMLLRDEISSRIKKRADPYIVSKNRPQWYDEQSRSGHHWPALASYLVKEKGWDKSVVTESISPFSSHVVAELGDPWTKEFDVRGLVVGYVQSGKTANMTGVIARAVDAGYNFVVVLAGTTDKLRHQTQVRLDEDLCARIPNNWHWMTRPNDYDGSGIQTDKGEYTGETSRKLPRLPRDVCRIAVIKKHPAIVRRVISDISNSHPKLRSELRMLVIDDESDQASVNSGKSDTDPTSTNRAIRELMNSVSAVSYVGYTATPYANILINPWPVEVAPKNSTEAEDEDAEKHLEDLYPRDFIIALPKPDRYFGAEQIFGRDPIDQNDDEVDGLDIIRQVSKDEVDVLKAKDQTPQLSDVPTLKKAIHWFLLTVAARIVRGHSNKHQSMLIHTSMKKTDHSDIEGMVVPEVENLQANIGDQELHEHLRDLWDSEKDFGSSQEFGNDPVEFDDILEALPEAASKLSIAVENSSSDERLNYDGEPLAVIAIGGNILSRGLTLEGLCVTYFCRASKQYDTLLQMGRWFGYRSGYEDLVRLWLPENVKNAFRQLASVEHSLREEIAEYAQRQARPLDFAVRIPTLPGLQVTARNKMRHAKTANLDYRGQHLKTVRFERENKKQLASNWEAAARLLSAAKIGEETQVGAANVSHILTFLNNYSAHESQREFDPKWMESYIRTNAHLLENWSVVLFQPQGHAAAKTAAQPMGEFHPKLIERSRLKDTDPKIADLKHLMSRSDVFSDLAEDQHPEGSEWRQKWSWAALKKWREDQIGSVPMIILYPVDKDSEPDVRHKLRTSLKAAHDFIGVGIIFPYLGRNAGNKAVKSISVDLTNPNEDGYEDEEDQDE